MGSVPVIHPGPAKQDAALSRVESSDQQIARELERIAPNPIAVGIASTHIERPSSALHPLWRTDGYNILIWRGLSRLAQGSGPPFQMG
jgi:hypothetical protein